MAYGLLDPSMNEGWGEKAELTPENPTHQTRLPNGRLATFQHYVPEGFAVDVYVTTGNHKTIMDARSMKAVPDAKAARFIKVQSLKGDGIVNYEAALNGLRLVLRQDLLDPQKGPASPPDEAETTDGPIEPKDMKYNQLQRFATDLGLSVVGRTRETILAEVEAKIASMEGRPAEERVVARKSDLAVVMFTYK